MKFTVDKNAFLEQLIPAMGTVSNKNTISSIEGVLIETLDDESVQISTYDMNKGVRAVIHGVTVDEPGSNIINAQRLFSVVRVMPDDDMTIEVNDKFITSLSCGKSEFSMVALPGSDFPNLPDLISDRGFSVSAEVLRKLIGKVSHSVAEADNRPMLCGAFFKVNKEGIEVVSTDSFILSKVRQNCEIEKLGIEEADQLSFIIPGHALGELTKILSNLEDQKVAFYLSRKHAIIKGENITFFTRTIDSEYLDYNRVIPRNNDIVIEVDRERFLSGLDRANIIAEEKIQGSGKSYVKLHVGEQTLTMTSVSVNGKVSDEMDIVHEGGDIDIGFNCRYLMNSVKVAEGEAIRMSMKAPTQAVVIEPVEKDEDFDYLYMVLPVRMNG
ncbi:MAG: DNA polymerase III subunit beta [Clostridia bacterium]|nr:DNA polymerase III subunit beta [Clostridia bacterium]